MLSRVGSYVNRLLPWSLRVKLVLGAVLGPLGAAGLLAYLSEYATYSYAIYIGIRPPLEGIPYLSATVAFGSLFLLLSGALVFALAFFLLRGIIGYIHTVLRISSRISSRIFSHGQYRLRSEDEVLSDLRSAPLVVVVGVSAVVGTTFGGSVYVVNLVTAEMSAVVVAVAAVSVGVFSFVSSISVLRPRLIWWFGGLFTALYFSTSITLLFVPGQYSAFLRLVGYGGGLPVVIELLNEPSTTSETSAGRFYLMLRTTEAFILFDSDQNSFVEIPRNQLRRLTHATGGLSNLPFVLPRK